MRAVEIEEYRGWTPKGPPPMYNWKARAPVKPGKTFSVVLEFGWNGKATQEGHAVEPPDRVRVKLAEGAARALREDARRGLSLPPPRRVRR